MLKTKVEFLDNNSSYYQNGITRVFVTRNKRTRKEIKSLLITPNNLHQICLPKSLIISLNFRDFIFIVFTIITIIITINTQLSSTQFDTPSQAEE